MTGAADFLPAPNMLGAPAKYDRWRSMQADAVVAAADSKRRVTITGAPTGFGKSLTVVCTGLLTNARMVILTSTKALMGQYGDDYKESGLIEIKGLNAYPCNEGTPTGKFGDMRREGYRADRGLPMMCDEAPCQAGAYCKQREGGCQYYDAYRKAGSPASRLIVTNYAYFMSIHKFGEGLGPIDILVLDEAHNAVDELGGFIGTEMRPGEIEGVMAGEAQVLSPGADQLDWKAWGVFWLVRATTAHEALKAQIREAEYNRAGEAVSYATLRRARDLKRILHKLETIANMSGDWIIDWAEDNHGRPIIKFDPVWPGEYAEKVLFLNIPKIVMVSATVRPKTAEMLGFRPQDIEFKEYPSTFPVKNRPIIYIPSGHMNIRSETLSLGAVCTMADNIIGRRLDRKAIIQTVSYNRARKIYLGSKHKDLMLLHDNTNTREVIAQFKSTKRPVILVSPVLDTGYDFPYEQAEYQILIKVPFPVTIDKIMKARVVRDPSYKDYVTMVTIVQMAGRIVRAEDDQGETFILDSDFGWWFFGSYGKQGKGIQLAPKWFTEAVRTEQMLGMPLPKLIRVA